MHNLISVVMFLLSMNLTCNNYIYSIDLAHCKSSLKWLNLEALSMMGPYVTRLAPHDLDSSPKEKVREVCKEA